MMLLVTTLPILSVVLSLTAFAAALGSTCSSPLGPGRAAPNDPFWLEQIKHQGKSAFNADPNAYQVFRSVKDFGAVGDGVHDDTEAINKAISSGNRCGGGPCRSSTVSPAVVYFPRGTYLVSSPIVPYYFTELVGDAKSLPTLLAAPSFSGFAVIDADPYIPGASGAQWWNATNNFHRSVRNFIIDTRRMLADNNQGTGIHWQVAQATSLYNIIFEMSDAVNTAHQGIWMENGSGGFMADLVFNGGKYGIWGGSQQFTVRNVTINNSKTGIFSSWNWGFTYQGVTINNAEIGFDVQTGGLTLADQTTGALAIIDVVVTNTPQFIRTSKGSTTGLAGSIVLNNIKLNNVTIAVGVLNGDTVLNGGTMTIDSWVQGNVYLGTTGSAGFRQLNIPAPSKPQSLLDHAGRILGKTRPQYAAYSLGEFVSVKDLGAKGDGISDDTAVLKDIFAKYSGCKIIFFDAGTYVVTDTVTIPAGTQMVGEVWTTLAGKGVNFQDQNNPRVVFQVGDPGSQGVTEISDFVFSTIGPAAGAIVVEWNVRDPQGVQAGAGLWDSHIRLGGASGTQLEGDKCPQSGAGGFDSCFSAFMGLHLTPSSTAYIEGAWVWLSDHDLDIAGENKISLYSGRGILSESKGPVWLIGTGSEHHVLYQYSLVNAANHYLGLIQTESPYFQPSPVAPTPFHVDPRYNDPTASSLSAWALHIAKSNDITVFGAGLYSFFDNYSEDQCKTTESCQDQIANIDSASSGIHIYSLSTIRSTYQLSVDGKGVINQAANRNGQASTVTSWSQS
ncbi:exo-beta-1,3-glucanase [Crepidotus variabilis]|uniref:Exo-beta-1,3-glucanase n=1 Tax=Crepidotus variabilis TaxID=179855 RepID=A0A9P6EKH5_9AGAR|nr:exo-beta-1,3-glucanase [Crepidotus variabilis]